MDPYKLDTLIALLEISMNNCMLHMQKSTHKSSILYSVFGCLAKLHYILRRPIAHLVYQCKLRFRFLENVCIYQDFH